jgi:OmpA-OmpF porin, OOP family
MKYKLLIAFAIISVSGFAQTADNKNNISIGFGTQSYNGALGNSWFDFDYETYGFFAINYSRYINNMFDVTIYSTYGDYGHCKHSDDIQYYPDGERTLNMHSRLTTANLAVKYKFANGSILKENARIAPYLFAGAGIDNAQDIWDITTPIRVDQGNYFTVNGGGGVRINFTTRFNFTYNISFSYFTNDKIDENPLGQHPMNMQFTYSVGYNL